MLSISLSRLAFFSALLWAIGAWAQCPVLDPVQVGTGAQKHLLQVKGKIFNPRGANYTRLDSSGYHQTFDPDTYEAGKAEDAFKRMQKYGYNSVRVFVSSRFMDQGFQKGSAPGVDEVWISHIADFICRAARYGVYTILTGAWLPANYYSIVGSESSLPFVDGVNQLILVPGLVKAQAQLWKDILFGLKTRHPEITSNLLYVDVINELHFSSEAKPFDQTQGLVTYRGQKFDLAKPQDKQALADLGTVQWMNTIRSAIREVAPTVLVTSSFFTLKAVGRQGFDGLSKPSQTGDFRAPGRIQALLKSDADLVDLHVYVHGDLSSLEEDLTSAELQKGFSLAKPLIMGEYGSVKSGSPSRAQKKLMNLISNSCAYGFSGWLQWTWDTLEQKPAFWTAAEQKFELGRILSPSYWPQICLF